MSKEKDTETLKSVLLETEKARDEYLRMARLHGDELIKVQTELAECTQKAHEEIAQLKKALEPFAEAARWYDRDYCIGDVVLWRVILKVDDLWNARDALKNQERA